MGAELKATSAYDLHPQASDRLIWKLWKQRLLSDGHTSTVRTDARLMCINVRVITSFVESLHSNKGNVSRTTR